MTSPERCPACGAEVEDGIVFRCERSGEGWWYDEPCTCPGPIERRERERRADWPWIKDEGVPTEPPESPEGSNPSKSSNSSPAPDTPTAWVLLVGEPDEHPLGFLSVAGSQEKARAMLEEEAHEARKLGNVEWSEDRTEWRSFASSCGIREVPLHAAPDALESVLGEIAAMRPAVEWSLTRVNETDLWAVLYRLTVHERTFLHWYGLTPLAAAIAARDALRGGGA